MCQCHHQEAKNSQKELVMNLTESVDSHGSEDPQTRAYDWKRVLKNIFSDIHGNAPPELTVASLANTP